jgi:hypothetical protein
MGKPYSNDLRKRIKAGMFQPRMKAEMDARLWLS